MFKSVETKLRNDLKTHLLNVKLRCYKNRLNLTFQETGLLSPVIKNLIKYLQVECIPYQLTDDGLKVVISIETTGLSIGDQINLSNKIIGVA